MLTRPPRPEAKKLFHELFRNGVQKRLEVLRGHHQDTYEHCFRVGLLAIDIGMDFGLNTEDLQDVGYGGLLHDIGKIAVPAELIERHVPRAFAERCSAVPILQNGLPEGERRLVRQHPQKGYEMLADFGNETVMQIALRHHTFQKYAYPTDLEKPDPRLAHLTQIVVVADALDAAAHKRSYKPALPRAQAEPVMRENFTGDPVYMDKAVTRFVA